MDSPTSFDIDSRFNNTPDDKELTKWKEIWTENSF